jgi:hypothetical protein
VLAFDGFFDLTKQRLIECMSSGDVEREGRVEGKSFRVAERWFDASKVVSRVAKEAFDVRVDDGPRFGRGWAPTE